jgi:hypothetical protein
MNIEVLSVYCDDFRQDSTFSEYVVVLEHITAPIAKECLLVLDMLAR